MAATPMAARKATADLKASRLCGFAPVNHLSDPYRFLRLEPDAVGLPALLSKSKSDLDWGAARNVVGIWCGAISGNMKVAFQAARSIG